MPGPGSGMATQSDIHHSTAPPTLSDHPAPCPNKTAGAGSHNRGYRRVQVVRSARDGWVADDYDDRAEYSEDTLYRWWWERRWGDGPGLCWVGLNPSTGDTTGRPRATLRKVVALAKAHHLNAVSVVNLFSWRATKPADLKRAAASRDIVGERTNGVIARHPLYVRADTDLVRYGEAEASE